MAYGSSSFGATSYGGAASTAVTQIKFFLSGYLLKTKLTTFTLDARLILRQQKTFTLDSRLVFRKTSTFTLNAALQDTFLKTFTISAAIKKLNVLKTFSIDARLIFRREKTFTLDGALRKTQTKTFSLSARVYYVVSWLSPWKCRKLGTAVGTVPGAQTNATVPITVFFGSGTDGDKVVYLNGRCRADFSDVRFTKQNGVTLLQHSIATFTPSVSAIMNIVFPYLPGTDGQTNFYIYYKN